MDDSTKFRFGNKTISDLFRLNDKVIILTGAAGKLSPSYDAKTWPEMEV